MRSAGNRGVVQSRLQVLHVHVFLVAPLGARHMAEPGTDQHQGGIAIRERPYHTGTSANLTVQPLDHIVGADTCPMLAWKVAVGKRFFNAILHFLRCFFQLHRFQLGDDSFCFFTGGIFIFLCMDCLKPWHVERDVA